MEATSTINRTPSTVADSVEGVSCGCLASAWHGQSEKREALTVVAISSPRQIQPLGSVDERRWSHVLLSAVLEYSTML